MVTSLATSQNWKEEKKKKKTWLKLEFWIFEKIKLTLN
jgi:hypothetical protein